MALDKEITSFSIYKDKILFPLNIKLSTVCIYWEETALPEMFHSSAWFLHNHSNYFKIKFLWCVIIAKSYSLKKKKAPCLFQYWLLTLWFPVAANDMVIRSVVLNSRARRYFNWLFGWNCTVYYEERMLSYMKHRNSVQFISNSTTMS